MERDENYIPNTRSQYKLPGKKLATKIDYSEAFEETPVVTVYRLFVQQFLCVSLLGRMGMLTHFSAGGGFI
jgi:omega-6 fatty acid desaturase (delta-12 desaturase)